MKVKEIIEILQKHSPNREIIFLSGNKIYTVKSDDPDQIKQELDRQEFLTRIMKPTNPYECKTRLEKAYEFIEDFTRQINRSIMVENQILITELNNIKKLLTDLYEGIDEYYTETLERNDELAVARADAELQLIKKIIDKVEKI